MASRLSEQEASAKKYMKLGANFPHALSPYDKWFLFLPIIAVTFLQKFCLPAGLSELILLTVVLVFGVTICGCLFHRLVIHKTRFALFLFMAGGLTLGQVFCPAVFSLASLTLLLLMHLPYIFVLPKGVVENGIELRFFQKVMAVLAVAGLFQFTLQFLIGWQYAFFIDTQFPKYLIMDGFNKLNALRFGLPVYKSNGFFLLEASIFCQYLALAIIIELVYFKRAKFMVLYIAGILVTFSGTGLIMLALVIPVFLIRKGRYLLFLCLALGVAVLVAVAPFIGLGTFVDRAGEFTTTHSSGFARFFGIFRVLYDFVIPHGDTLFFGMGAGNIKNIYGLVDYGVHDPSWGKVAFEYGLLGMLLYFPFILNVIWTSSRSRYLKAAFTIQFFFLGGYLLTPLVHSLMLALLAWPALQPVFQPISERKSLA